MKKTIHVSLGLVLVAQIWMPANVLAHETDASAARHNKPLSWQGPENLGEVSFESSCKVSGAIDLVNNGLKLLHSFEYEFSREKLCNNFKPLLSSVVRARPGRLRAGRGDGG